MVKKWLLNMEAEWRRQKKTVIDFETKKLSENELKVESSDIKLETIVIQSTDEFIDEFYWCVI